MDHSHIRFGLLKTHANNLGFSTEDLVKRLSVGLAGVSLNIPVKKGYSNAEQNGLLENSDE